MSVRGYGSGMGVGGSNGVPAIKGLTSGVDACSTMSIRSWQALLVLMGVNMQPTHLIKGVISGKYRQHVGARWHVRSVCDV